MSAPLQELADGLASHLAEAAGRLLAEGPAATAAEPTVHRGDENVFEGLSGAAVAILAGYANTPEGGNVVVLDADSARALIGSSEEGPLGEGELADIRSAGVNLLEAAARAVSAALGTRVAFDSPAVRVYGSAGEAAGTLPFCTHQVRAGFQVGECAVRVACLIPQTVAVRLSDELDGMAAIDVEARPAWHGTQAAKPSLAGVAVRVSAELGRAALPSQDLVGLPSGHVVELDRRVEDPIEIVVNGRPYASGRLVVADTGEWAVEIDHVLGI